MKLRSNWSVSFLSPFSIEYNVVFFFQKTYDKNNHRGYFDIFYQEYLKQIESEKKMTYSQLIMMTIQTLIGGMTSFFPYL